MRLKPVTVGAKRLQIDRGVVVVVAIYMINVQLTEPFWYEATPLALRTFRVTLMLIASA